MFFGEGHVMNYLAELKKLNHILMAELEGHPFDRNEASHLVERLQEQCPDIASTLASIGHRLAPQAMAKSA
jgi:hypothetical protein